MRAIAWQCSSWFRQATARRRTVVSVMKSESIEFPILHSTAQHSTAQHSSAQLSTAQLSAAQHSSAQHSAAQPTLHTVAYACVQHVANYYWREGSFRSLTLSATIGCHCAALRCAALRCAALLLWFSTAQRQCGGLGLPFVAQCRTVTSAEVRVVCAGVCCALQRCLLLLSDWIGSGPVEVARAFDRAEKQHCAA